MLHKNGILSGINNKKPYNIIARKIFLSYPTSVFIGNEDVEFDICNKISEHFKIPITSVQVSGSGKVGYSYFKCKWFEPGKSDLDIAIIDMNLFNKYMSIVYDITKGYTNQSDFPREKGVSVFNQYIKCLSRGFFRPDLMPNHLEKLSWNKFFNEISREYFKMFKNINAGIYLSQFFFEQKQSEVIEKFIEIGGERI